VRRSDGLCVVVEPVRQRLTRGAAAAPTTAGAPAGGVGASRPSNPATDVGGARMPRSGA